MGSGPLVGPVGEPVVEGFEGGVVDGDGAFVVQLAERDPQPGAVGAVVDEVVELEVEELTDAQPGVTQHGDGDAGEPVVEVGDGGHDGGSMSGGSARGSVSGWRGMSASNISRRAGASAQPQAVMSSRKARTVIAAWAWT